MTHLPSNGNFSTHANPHCMKKTRMAPNINLSERKGGVRGAEETGKGLENGKQARFTITRREINRNLPKVGVTGIVVRESGKHDVIDTVNVLCFGVCGSVSVGGAGRHDGKI